MLRKCGYFASKILAYSIFTCVCFLPLPIMAKGAKISVQQISLFGSLLDSEIEKLFKEIKEIKTTLLVKESRYADLMAHQRSLILKKEEVAINGVRAKETGKLFNNWNPSDYHTDMSAWKKVSFV